MQIVLERQGFAVEPLDGQLFELLPFPPNVQGPRGSIDFEQHDLSMQFLADIVVMQGDLDGAGSHDAAAQQATFNGREPSIRIHEVRQGRKRWKGGKSTAGRLIGTTAGLVGAFVVVVPTIGINALLRGFKGGGSLDLKSFGFERAMIAFNIGVFIGAMRRTDDGANTQTMQKAH